MYKQAIAIKPTNVSLYHKTNNRKTNQLPPLVEPNKNPKMAVSKRRALSFSTSMRICLDLKIRCFPLLLNC